MSTLLIGTGNIAHAHAQALKAIGRPIASVFDTNTEAAKRFASTYGAAKAHDSLEAALADAAVSAVHILTPPDSHAALVQQAYAAGKAVFAEKPVCTTPEQFRALQQAGLDPKRVAVNQNFCFHPAFAPVLEAARSNSFGRLRHIEVVFHPALRQLAARQFTHWMFTSPLNLLLEQAVHPLSQVLALTGQLGKVTVQPGQVIDVAPGAGFVPEFSAAIDTPVARVGFHFMVGANFPTWRLSAFFDDGWMVADMIANTTQTMGRTRFLEQADTTLSTAKSAIELAANGIKNIATYGASQLGVVGRSDSFFLSVKGAVREFYTALGQGRPALTNVDFGMQLVDVCMRIGAPMDAMMPTAPAAVPVQQPIPEGPLVLVLGGTGFIGKPTVRRLREAGYRVRVMARGTRNLPSLFSEPGVELVRGDVKSEQDLKTHSQGVDFVVNLAHGGGGANYEQIKAAMVDSAVAALQAAADHGVKRLVHVGSIAGLYLGNPNEVITGSTPPDPEPEKRGDYGRAKAVADGEILKAAGERNVDAVILRPGIVVGEGTGALHSGLGLFNNDQHVIGWNHGRNVLPFVLADDCAKAIVGALQAQGIAGKCYNLAGDAVMSAREFLDELSQVQQRPIRFHPSSPRMHWLVDVGKWAIKRVGGKKAPMPSIRDFASRAMFARFDCSDAKKDLNWQPVASREELVARAIGIHA
jgi:nucleoside-diphosphate-sugar epimerase/predicted dehydrogenase